MMDNKITIEFQSETGRRLAIDRIITPLETMNRVPMVKIRIGFESITMPRILLGEMLRQLQMAEIGGAEYPEDYEGLAKAGYSLA
jgi:hypothetical protein